MLFRVNCWINSEKSSMQRIKAWFAIKIFKFRSSYYITKKFACTWLKSCFGLNVILKKYLSDFPATPSEISLPASSIRTLNFILLVRGITHNNKLLRSLAAKSLNRLTVYALENISKKNPEPLPQWDYNSNTIKELRDNFLCKERPVIIKNFPHAASQWNLDYFIKSHGNREIIFTDSTGENFKAPLSLLGRIRRERLSFYAHNCARILHHEDFDAGLSLALMKDTLEYWRCKEVFDLNLGAFQGSGSPLHCAPSCNVFYQIEGEKRWTLIHPNYTHFVYPALTSMNEFQGSAVPFPLADEHYEQFPLAFHCPRYSATLGPGDVLLVPQWWYHSVENLSSTSVGIATRWQHSDSNLNTNYLYTLLLHNMRSFAARLKIANHSNSIKSLFDNAHKRNMDNLLHDFVSHDQYHSRIKHVAREAWSIKSKY